MTGSTAAATIITEPKVSTTSSNNSAKMNANVSCSTTDASPASSSDANSPSPSLQSRSKFMNSSTNGGSNANNTTTATNTNTNTNTNSNSSSSSNSNANSSNQHTVCKNCYTVTTPLWRRDESGAVLCNACGLFLKLHGRPRPISLKTDVIKSRNRKGNHSHSNSHNHTPPSPRGTPSGEDKKRKSDDKIKINNKKVKSENKEELQRLEGTEITKAASTLGNINRNCNGVASPTLSASNVSRSGQLPHLSTLLGEVNSQSQPQPLRRSNSPLPPPVTMLDSTRSAVSSPSMLPQNPKVYQMSSINDVLSPSNALQQQASNSLTDPSGRFSPIPTSQYHQPQPSFLPIALPRVGSPQQQSQSVLENQLRNEEEIIRLRTRISELELVTDLYKRHIFELDEKCKSLQDEVDQIKQQQQQLQLQAQ